MKKFYAIAAAALATMSMNAQLYFTGSFDGWTPENAAEATLADGWYTINMNPVNKFKMSTVKGGWDEFNAAALQLAGGFVITGETLGTNIPIEAGDGDIDLPWQGDYTVKVKADYSVMVVTTVTPEPTDAPAVYLRGAMNDWGNSGFDPEYTFTYTKQEDGFYFYELWITEDSEIITGEEFKIADADWGNVNFGADAQIDPDLGDEVGLVYNGSNCSLSSDFTGLIIFRLNSKLTSHEAYVLFDTEAGVKSVAIDNNAPVEYFNLQGVRVANPENGLFIARQGNTVTKVVK